jgi:hypothetical protein
LGEDVEEGLGEGLEPAGVVAEDLGGVWGCEGEAGEGGEPVAEGEEAGPRGGSGFEGGGEVARALEGPRELAQGAASALARVGEQEDGGGEVVLEGAGGEVVEGEAAGLAEEGELAADGAWGGQRERLEGLAGGVEVGA